MLKMVFTNKTCTDMPVFTHLVCVEQSFTDSGFFIPHIRKKQILPINMISPKMFGFPFSRNFLISK